METLVALHEKIEKLIAALRDLRAENEFLLNENKQLEQKLASTFAVVQKNEHDVKELSDEKSRTKVALVDLINSIDSFIVAE